MIPDRIRSDPRQACQRREGQEERVAEAESVVDEEIGFFGGDGMSGRELLCRWRSGASMRVLNISYLGGDGTFEPSRVISCHCGL